MDQIVKFEFIDASGRVHNATATENADILFSFKGLPLITRGSGTGSYGIITKFTIQLTRVPAIVTYITNEVQGNLTSAVTLFHNVFKYSAEYAPNELSGVVLSVKSNYTKVQAM
jgi:FAD/FMN-containing dehydrogenase